MVGEFLGPGPESDIKVQSVLTKMDFGAAQNRFRHRQSPRKLQGTRSPSGKFPKPKLSDSMY